MLSVLYGAVSGLLLVLSLPKPDFYPLAWIGFVPLLVAVRRSSFRHALLSAYVTGLIFFAGTFYWITETMTIYGGVGPLAAIGVGLLFCTFYALHFVLLVLIVWGSIQRWGSVGLLTAAPGWVAVELLRTYLISGFPWMLTGYALVPFSGILQVVTWTGVYGLSFIATALNSVLALGLVENRRIWIAGSVAVAVLLSVLPIIPSPAAPSGDPINVRLVQTNISLDQPWQEPASTQLMDELTRLSSAPPGTVRLIVWPETPAPFYLKEDADFRQRIERIALSSDAYVLVGYIDKMGEGPTNSSGLVDPRGVQVSRFDKIHLVPFGEYVPLKKLLFFADSLTRQVGDFTAGTDFTVSPLDNHRFSTAICYESIFPDLVRRFVKRGAEMLVVITNDGWFGESSAPFQHLRMGVVRAVENRRYEGRSANTGISAIIDPYGRIENPTPIGRRMVVDGKAYFRNDLTFYTQYGDVFAYLNVLVILIIGVVLLKTRRMNVRRSH